jgi:alpha-1,2-mannosyltransferase
MPAAGRLGVACRAAVVILMLQFIGFGLVRPIARPYVYSDFVTFYAAAHCFAAHQNAYDPAVLRAASPSDWHGWVGRYFYPPPFAAFALRPLAALPFEWSRRLWVLIEAFAYVAAAALLAAMHLPAGRRTLVVALALPFTPVVLDLRLGSVSGVLLLLVAAAWRARAAGHTWRAALPLAAAVLLKLTPLLVVAYWLVRGERRLVLATLAALAALVAVALPVTGVAPYVTYARDVLPFLEQANFSWFTNQSLDAFFWRLLVANPDTTPWIVAPGFQRAATVIASGVVLAAIFWLAHRTRAVRPGAAVDQLASGAALAAAPLVSRVAWEYLVVLALPLFLAWAGWMARGRERRRDIWGVAVAWLLCAAAWPYADAPLRSGWGLVLEAPRTYGLVLLLGLTCGRVARAASGLSAIERTAAT